MEENSKLTQFVCGLCLMDVHARNFYAHIKKCLKNYEETNGLNSPTKIPAPVTQFIPAPAQSPQPAPAQSAPTTPLNNKKCFLPVTLCPGNGSKTCLVSLKGKEYKFCKPSDLKSDIAVTWLKEQLDGQEMLGSIASCSFCQQECDRSVMLACGSLAHKFLFFDLLICQNESYAN
jgi:hypothetical protein